MTLMVNGVEHSNHSGWIFVKCKIKGFLDFPLQELLEIYS